MAGGRASETKKKYEDFDARIKKNLNLFLCIEFEGTP